MLLLSILSLELAVVCGSFVSNWDVSSADAFIRLRRRMVGRGGASSQQPLSLVAIDGPTMDVYGLYGRSQWLTRKPFVEQLNVFAAQYDPTVLAYDVLFHETLGESSSDEKPVTESPVKLNRIGEEVSKLAADPSGLMPDTVLYDLARLSAEQGDVLFMDALAPSSATVDERGFSVLLAYDCHGGWIQPQDVAVEGWSDQDVFGDSPDGDEDSGARLPYLRDVSIPQAAIHFADDAADIAYRCSPNASLPGLYLLDYCRLGFINVPRDEDGVIRRIPLITGLTYRNSATGQRQRMFVPSFSLMVAMMHLGVEFPLSETGEPGVEVFFGKEIILRPAGKAPVHIPVDDRGCLALNFDSRFNDYPVISFAEVNRKDFSSFISNRAVIVGIVATGLDVGPCPLSSHTPLMHVHATAVGNILAGSFLAPLGRLGTTLVYLLVFCAMTALCAVEKTARLSVSSIGASVLYALCAYLGVHFSVVVLPIVTPLLYMGFCSFTTMGYRYFTEEHGKKMIRAMFSTMVSPEVLMYLEENPGSFSLTGHKVEASVFFSDLVGFTHISEGLDPSRLAGLLNSYLTAVTDCIMDHGGYVDKFVGDMVMAVWGAPFPVEGHALHACRAALAQQQVIADNGERWNREYGFVIAARMGINSGIVSAGSMGSTRKLQYTVMGDGVNFASRLEPINRDYDTAVIIGDTTRTLAGDSMVTRELDKIVVRGKTAAVPIYELIGERGQVDDDKLEMIDLYERALGLYRERDWSRSLDILEKIGDRWDDGPAVALRRRVLDFRENPPSATWAGERVRTDKY